MENLKHKLKEINKKYLFVTKCSEPADELKQNEKILVFTEKKLEIYDLEQKQINNYGWNEIKKANFQTNSTFLSFGTNDFSFNSKETGEIQKRIIEIAQTMLSNKELHTKEMSPFSKVLSKPTLSSVLNRISNKAETLKINNTKEVIKVAEMIYKNRITKVDFSLLSDPMSTAPLLFDVIPLFNFVNTVVLTSATEYDYSSYINFLALNDNYIEYIVIEGDMTKPFNDFLSLFAETTTSKQNGFIFNNTKFESDQLKNISTTIAVREISSAGFSNTFNDKTSIDNFYQNFVGGDSSSKLKKLSIANTPLISMETLITKLSNLTSLSLCSCGLEISSCLLLLPKSKLRILNLSGNKFSKKISKIEYHNLSTIILKDVEWYGNTLSEFFIFISRSFDQPLNFDLSNAIADAKEWVKFFCNAKKFYFSSIQELVWDNNPIHPTFFNYLKENPNLSSLSMSGCISESNTAYISSFCNLLLSATSLKRLILESNEIIYLGKMAVPIISTIILMPSLEYLDLTGSKCGNAGVCQLTQLLKSSLTLQTVNFEGSSPTSCSSYADLIDAVIKVQKDRKFQFSWPENDLLYLIEYHKLRHSKYDSMKASLTDKNGFLYRKTSSQDFDELTRNVHAVDKDSPELSISESLFEQKEEKKGKKSNSETTDSRKKKRKHKKSSRD